jgi:hypothetical protein
MTKTDKIYYSCATVRVDSNEANANTDSARGRVNAVAHFYVLTDSETSAGAVLFDICRESGMEFVSYVYLPQEETEMTLHSGQEHKIAFDYAAKHGEAVIVSRIFDERRSIIDLTQYFE